MIETRHIETNGIRLHVVEAGPRCGPPVILLHGFPEFWRGWIRQIPALVEAGFRVTVPDQRGYNLSSKPQGIAAYDIRLLVSDVIGLMDALGHEQVCLAGHDWGGAVAWAAALAHPRRLSKLAILNVPHPAVMLRSLRRNPRQMLRSWYMGLFQLPLLPETLLRARNWSLAAHLFGSSSRPGTFSEEDLEYYRRAWSQPGAITAMIHWYRALRNHSPLPDDLRVRVPTLMLWGMRDVALGAEMAQPSIDLCVGGKLVFFPEATHWVQHEEAAEVSRQLVEFFMSAVA